MPAIAWPRCCAHAGRGEPRAVKDVPAAAVHAAGRPTRARPVTARSQHARRVRVHCLAVPARPTLPPHSWATGFATCSAQAIFTNHSSARSFNQPSYIRACTHVLR